MTHTPHSLVTNWNSVPQKTSPVASVWMLFVIFSFLFFLVQSFKLDGALLKLLRFGLCGRSYKWLNQNLFDHGTNAMCMPPCQYFSALSLVNTLAHITVWTTWYAVGEHIWNLGSEKKASKLCSTEVHLGQKRPTEW